MSCKLVLKVVYHTLYLEAVSGRIKELIDSCLEGKRLKSQEALNFRVYQDLEGIIAQITNIVIFGIGHLRALQLGHGTIQKKSDLRVSNRLVS